MTRTRNKGAAALTKAATTPPAEAEQTRRTPLTDESARATVKATLASGFPAQPQFAAQLGEAVMAEIRAELAAEAEGAAAPAAPATTQPDEA